MYRRQPIKLCNNRTPNLDEEKIISHEEYQLGQKEKVAYKSYNINTEGKCAVCSRLWCKKRETLGSDKSDIQYKVLKPITDIACGHKKVKNVKTAYKQPKDKLITPRATGSQILKRKIANNSPIKQKLPYMSEVRDRPQPSNKFVILGSQGAPATGKISSEILPPCFNKPKPTTEKKRWAKGGLSWAKVHEKPLPPALNDENYPALQKLYGKDG